MRFRAIGLVLLLIAMSLSACDQDTTPQPTPADTAVATPQVEATASPAEMVAETSTPEEATPAPQPTATQGADASPAQREPLTLRPVVIETNDATRKGVFGDEQTINLPPGFHARVFAAGLNRVRWTGLSPEGVVYATLTDEGQVVRLPDADKDGVADSVQVFAGDMPGVHGIDFRDGAVYVATEGELIRLEDTDKDGVADKREMLARDLPTGDGHFTRTIAFGPDGKLYVSVGSSCNVCNETNEKRATISRYTAGGEFEKVYAGGLRNAVGIIFHPITGDLWATNNGRDNIGDDVPPETIYNVKEDVHYGWPYCYGDRVPDRTQNVPSGFCEKTGVPAVEMQAHSAPLGLAFYTGEQFPAEFRGDMFVGFHGSWNRSVPTGYKLVRVRMRDNQVDASAGNLLVEDFATGWTARGDVWGRPVNPMTALDGSLLLTDDKADAIYSIYYREDAGP